MHKGGTRLQSWNPTPQKPSTSTGWGYSPFLSPFQETSAAHCCEFFTGQGTFFSSPKLHSKNFYILALGPHLAVLRSHFFLGGGAQAAPVANVLTPAAQFPVLSGTKDGDGPGSNVMF